MKIDWKRKLTSRKFLVALIMIAAGILILLGADGEAIELIVGGLLVGLGALGYNYAEAKVDAANAKQVAEEIIKRVEGVVNAIDTVQKVGDKQ